MDNSKALLYIFALLGLGFSTCLGVYEHIKQGQMIRNQDESNVTYSTYEMEYSNQSVVLGKTAHLHCTIRNIGERRVSWIRKSDLHVLTSGILTFTRDQRFSAHHSQKTDMWALQIKFTQMRDTGEYQCQVNTDPKISHAIHLEVKEAIARIGNVGNKEVHVRHKSKVELSCVVDLGEGHHATAIFWYLNGHVIDQRESNQVTKQHRNQLESTITINQAEMRHAGQFTCAPSYARPDTVTLHVIDGESRAELQTNSGSKPGTCLLNDSHWKTLRVLGISITSWLCQTLYGYT